MGEVLHVPGPPPPLPGYHELVVLWLDTKPTEAQIGAVTKADQRTKNKTKTHE